MRLSSRTAQVVLAAAAALASVPVLAQPAGWPSKPLRIIVPFPPGDTADIVSRLIGPRLTERFGQPVVIENRAGAAGQIGLEAAAKATPDGYTFALGQGSNMVVAPHTFKKLPYDPQKDFVPVALIATNYAAILVHPTTPFKSAKELIAYARANPGKLSIGTNGEGTFSHLSMEDLGLQGGFKYLHVPFKGTAQIITEVMSGRIDGAIGGFTPFAPHVKAGKLRLLGFTNPTRVAQFPDVPVIAESLKGYDAGGWFGIVAPAGTPREIVAAVNKAVNDALNAAEVRDAMVQNGLLIVQQPPEFFAELIRRDFVKYGKLAKSIGFQPQ
jgi:tripartite-type tricarboxylate transporter receptor subunit TctC